MKITDLQKHTNGMLNVFHEKSMSTKPDADNIFGIDLSQKEYK